MPTKPYNIFDLGLDSAMNRQSSLLSFIPEEQMTSIGALSSTIPSSIRPESFSSGELPSIIYIGKTSFSDTTIGMREGLDGNDYKWIIGNSTNSVDFNVTTSGVLTVSGAIAASTIDIGGSDATSFHVDIDGNMWLGAGTFAGAIASIANTGVGTFSKVTISGGSNVSFISDTLDTSTKKILKDFTFGSTDYAGSFKSGDITWNAATGAVTGGSGILLYKAGIVGANTGAVTFTIDGVTGAATFAGALSAPTGNIGGFTIGATTLSATNLTLTAGVANTANINVGTGANLAGLNSANAGTDIAIWAGSTFTNRATAPFRVNAQGDVTMTSATISGYLVSTKGTFGGDGSDGVFAISTGTTTINLGGANVYVLNYTSVSITGDAKLAFSNPAAGGTKIIIKSKGVVTITSSTSPTIDLTSIGASNGAVPAANANGNNGTNVNTDLVLDTTSHQGLAGSKDAGMTGGVGGVIYSNLSLYSSTMNRMIRKFIEAPPGSGGGSGASAGTGAALGGAGGRGGGSLIIECGGAYNVSSTLSVAGTNGSSGDNGALNFGGAGGGGGGAAGNIIIMYNTLTSDTGTYTITGGNGGNGGNTGGGAPGGNGGGAGSGAGAYNGAGGDGGRGGDGTGNQANGVAATGSSNGSGGTKGTGTLGGGGGGGGSGGFSVRVLNNFFA